MINCYLWDICTFWHCENGTCYIPKLLIYVAKPLWISNKNIWAMDNVHIFSETMIMIKRLTLFVTVLKNSWVVKRFTDVEQLDFPNV